MSMLERKPLSICVMSLLFVGFMCAGCSRDVWNTLNGIESYMQESPDSALVELRKIDSSDIYCNRVRAKYSLLLSMALDKNYIDTTDLRIIHPAVEYYGKHGPNEYLLKALYYEGRVHFNGGYYDEAVVDYTKALPLVEKTSDVKYHGMLYMAMSAAFDGCNDYMESAKYTKLAYETFSAANMEQQATASLHALAGDLFDISDYKGADSLYSLLLSNPEIVNPKRAEIEASYAFMCTAMRDNYHKADSLYSSAVRSRGKLNSDKQWGSYAFTLSKLGKYAKSDSILTELKDRDPRTYIYWKSLSDAARGDSASAYKYLIMTLDARDTTVLKSLYRSSVKAQRDYFEESNQDARVRLQSRTLLSIILVCLIIALLVIGVMWMEHRELSFQMEFDRVSQLRESLLDKLKARNDVLERERAKLKESYIKVFRNQFAFLADIGEQLVTHKYWNHLVTRKMIYEKVHDALKDMLSDSGETEFERRIDESMENVMSKFREDFPDLPNVDYKFVSFVFAGFDITTIAVLLDFPTTGAASTKKSRIKKMIVEKPSPNAERYLEFF